MWGWDFIEKIIINLHYALYFELSKAKIHKNIGLNSQSHNPNQTDFQNFFASLNNIMTNKIQPMKETTPKTRFIALNIVHQSEFQWEIPIIYAHKDIINQAIQGQKMNQNQFFFQAILNSTQIFRIGIRDSRHFLQAFLNTIRIHTIIQIASANHRIPHEVHPRPNDVP